MLIDQPFVGVVSDNSHCNLWQVVPVKASWLSNTHHESNAKVTRVSLSITIRTRHSPWCFSQRTAASKGSGVAKETQERSKVAASVQCDALDGRSGGVGCGHVSVRRVSDLHHPASRPN